MRVLLDSNAYTRMRSGHAAVLELLRSSREVMFSSVVFGELLAGFYHGARLTQNLGDLEDFLGEDRVRFVPVGRTTADRYARIATALRRKGKPIPSNDVWIAAHAMETGADLISFDQHFAQVDGLAWIDPSR